MKSERIATDLCARDQLETDQQSISILEELSAAMKQKIYRDKYDCLFIDWSILSDYNVLAGFRKILFLLSISACPLLSTKYSW